MAKISKYTAVSAPADTDAFVVVQGGVTKKMTYAQIKAGIIGDAEALIYKGVLNCSANPNYPAADAGHVYFVSVAGKVGGASGVTVAVGDALICNTDGTAAGNQATVGSKWNILEKNVDFGAVSITGGTIDGTPIGLTTPGLIRGQIDSIIKAASANLTAAEVSGTVISNYGQNAAIAHVLPAAAEGYNVVFNNVTGVAQTFRIDVTGTEQVMFDGVLTDAGDYIGVAAAAAGQQIQYYTAPLTDTTWRWCANTISGPWLAQ